MATIDTVTAGTELALAFEPPGHEQIPGSTILTRLNYYDGKFLRADDLRLEQDYFRRLVELDARAGGSGLVYGFDVTAGSGDTLTIGGGLAFDGTGRVLYMPAAFTVELQKLIAATRNSLGKGMQASAGSSFAICPPDAGTKPQAPSGAEFYVLTIAHAEDACGEEDVFGKLCDDGCATSTDRAFLVEGVIVRATPFQPRTPFVTWAKANESHIRSQLVSAFFADEKDFVPCQISKAGLDSGIWCNGAAAPTGWEVPIAVVGRLTSRTFVDEWVVRRERIETPPRRYWEGRMCMRPWDVFLAQVLQFQCQLPSVLEGHEGDSTETDPCAPHTAVIRKAWTLVNLLENAPRMGTAGTGVAEVDGPETATTVAGAPLATTSAGLTLSIPAVDEFRRDLLELLKTAALPSRQILLDGGLVELPPAGYLPVTPGTTPSVDEQVRRLMGPGVDLRFCVASADYVPRAFESAQHMDRISLVAGLEDAAKQPKVDIIVPDGALGTAVTRSAHGWDTTLSLQSQPTGGGTVAPIASGPRIVHGAGRTAVTSDGRAEFQFAGLEEDDAGAAKSPVALYGAITCEKDPFALAVNDAVEVSVEAALSEDLQQTFGEQVTAAGTFTVTSHQTGVDTVLVVLQGTIKGSGTTTQNTDISFDSVRLTLTIGIGSGDVVVKVTLDHGDGVSKAVVTLKDAPNVFSPQDALHLQALAALQKLGQVLGAHPYTDTIPARLFDPVAGTTGGGGITATRDWVLFHRRRIEECTIVTPTPTPTPVQTELHDVRFVPEGFPALLKNLSGGNLAGAINMSKHVGDAEFDLGTANLETAKATLLAEWKAVTGSTPSAAAIAGEAAASMLKAQAGAAVEACGAAVSVSVFPGLAAPGGYTAVTFVEGEVVETDVRVFGVKNSVATKAVLDRFTEDDGRSLTELLGDLKAELVDLDVFTYAPGGTDLPHTAALKAFDEVGLPVDVVASYLIAPRGDEVLSGTQFDLLIERLGGTKGGSEHGIGVDDDPWPATERQVALFLVGEAVDTVAYRAFGLFTSDLNLKMLATLRKDRDVKKFLAANLDPKIVDLGSAGFESGAPGPVDAASLMPFASATPTLPTQVERSVVVSRPGVAGQPLDDQLTALIAALGGTEVAGSRVAPFDGKADTWPFDEDHVAVFFVNVEVNERSRRSRESRA